MTALFNFLIYLLQVLVEDVAWLRDYCASLSFVEMLGVFLRIIISGLFMRYGYVIFKSIIRAIWNLFGKFRIVGKFINENTIEDYRRGHRDGHLKGYKEAAVEYEDRKKAEKKARLDAEQKARWREEWEAERAAQKSWWQFWK